MFRVNNIEGLKVKFFIEKKNNKTVFQDSFEEQENEKKNENDVGLGNDEKKTSKNITIVPVFDMLIFNKPILLFLQLLLINKILENLGIRTTEYGLMIYVGLLYVTTMLTKHYNTNFCIFLILLILSFLNVRKEIKFIMWYLFIIIFFVTNKNFQH